MEILSGSAAAGLSCASQANANTKAASAHKRKYLRLAKFILCRRLGCRSMSQRRVRGVCATKFNVRQWYLQCEIVERASLQREIELIQFDKG